MKKYTLSKKFTFEAAHKLPFHDGACQRLHGHSFVGWVECESDTLVESGPKQGMVIDYHEIKKVLQPLVTDYLDHQFLNETTKLESPTSENLAKWIYDRLKPELPMLTKVTVEETCTSKCTYCGC